MGSDVFDIAVVSAIFCSYENFLIVVIETRWAFDNEFLISVTIVQAVDFIVLLITEVARGCPQ
jgi:hypothetical protein